ncbi:MAG: saccharopine dehydrogenase [Chitinophagaceae bacterium]|nr:saccharopine dehydrogenase [Chitinophagaceae bacterium]
MKNIVLFGAGKSATVLITFLKDLAEKNQWNFIVADAHLESAKEKLNGETENAQAVRVSLENKNERQRLVQKADVVISLMPPALHHVIAGDCLQFSKHLLTASYVDDQMKSYADEAKKKGLLFLCEAGLDPGIDHMSAMKMIDEIKSKGGEIASFKSHCGGLIAPESDTNPWHYKITWNPRNVIMAGKNGARFKENGEECFARYAELFKENKLVEIPEAGLWGYYPNRDSLPYAALYGLENADTFIRTTLRHPEFCWGWKSIVDLKLTDEEQFYETDNLSIASFFRTHFEKNGFGDWINEMLMSRLSFAKEMMEKLKMLLEAEEQVETKGAEVNEEMMLVNDRGELDTVSLDDVKDKAAETVAFKMHEANITMKQLFFLGIDDETMINKGRMNAAEILQFIIEKKWALSPGDKDMVLMYHEFEYILDDEIHRADSVLMIKGEDSTHTAMAKTVGLPLGIVAQLLLEGKMNERGLHVPITPAFYLPVLNELEKHGISFSERWSNNLII